MKTFSPTAAISAGFSLTKANWVFAVFATLFFIIVCGLISGVPGIFSEEGTTLYKITELMMIVVTGYFTAGFYSAFLKVTDNQPHSFKNLFLGLDSKVLNFILLIILAEVAIYLIFIPTEVVTLKLLGSNLQSVTEKPELLLNTFFNFEFLAAFLGGILVMAYLYTRFGFSYLSILDKNLGVIDSLKESWRITEGNVWNLIVLYILTILVVLLGIIALIIGLLFALPVIILAYTWAYRQLSTK